MNNNINEKLLNMLKGMDQNKLKNSADAISKFLSSDMGSRLKNSLSESDKKALLETFMNMDENEAKKKLNNADLSKLKDMSIDDIKKKLR